MALSPVRWTRLRSGYRSWSRSRGQFGRDRLYGRSRDAHESCRHFLVGRAADILESFSVPSLLARPLDRGIGDGGAAGLLGLGVEDRDRQDAVVRATAL